MKFFLENWLQRVSQSDQKSYGKRELEIMIKSAVVKQAKARLMSLQHVGSQLL